jgi:hypothetical protein
LPIIEVTLLADMFSHEMTVEILLEAQDKRGEVVGEPRPGGDVNKEQMNKRKSDDEFARINLSYFNTTGEEVVYCPESRHATATQEPSRRNIHADAEEAPAPADAEPATDAS